MGCVCELRIITFSTHTNSDGSGATVRRDTNQIIQVTLVR